MLTRGNPPIWSAEAWAQTRVALSDRVREAAAGRWASVAHYLREPSEGMPRDLGIFVLLTMAMVAARRRTRHWATTPEGASPAMSAFERPFAAAVVIALIFVAAPNSPFPPTVRNVLIILGLGPVIRLVRLTVDPLYVELYVLWILFAIDSVREATAGMPLIEQTVLAIEMLAGIAALGLHAEPRGHLHLPELQPRGDGDLSPCRALDGLPLPGRLQCGPRSQASLGTCASGDCWPPGFSAAAPWR